MVKGEGRERVRLCSHKNSFEYALAQPVALQCLCVIVCGVAGTCVATPKFECVQSSVIALYILLCCSACPYHCLFFTIPYMHSCIDKMTIILYLMLDLMQGLFPEIFKVVCGIMNISEKIVRITQGPKVMLVACN